jgi:hypothetical protein
MNLFTPPQLTPAQEALLTMQQLRDEMLGMMADKIRAAFALFWQNDRATPQEMASALGTNAEAAFTEHALTAAFIAQRAPEIAAAKLADLLPPQIYRFEADGRITLL